MLNKSKFLSIIMAASIILASVSYPAMAEDQINITNLENYETGLEALGYQDEIVWGANENYSWSPEDNTKLLVNGIAFKLENSGELTVSPSNIVAPYLGNIYHGGYSSVNGTLKLPSKVIVNGVAYPVTKIANSCFFGCKNLTQIFIPDSIKSIGDFAFYLDGALEKVVLPSNLEHIGIYAFDSCTALNDITISPTNNYFTCEDNVLFNKDKTTLIQYFNKNLETYTVPSTVKTIKTNAFYYNNVIKNVIVSEGVETIGESAFSNCNSLNTLTLPSTLTSIDSCAFRYCPNLSTVTFAQNSRLAVIPDSAFLGCSNLSNVTLPDSLKRIEPYAFSYCNNLRDITLPNSLEYIGDYAFAYCPSLGYVSVPAGATVGQNAFVK